MPASRRRRCSMTEKCLSFRLERSTGRTATAFARYSAAPRKPVEGPSDKRGGGPDGGSGSDHGSTAAAVFVNERRDRIVTSANTAPLAREPPHAPPRRLVTHVPLHRKSVRATRCH